jgi:hypothetical protein
MKRYFAYRYRDAFEPFERALQRAGYIPTESPGRADIIFLDHEKRLRTIDRPLFLYPHTPYSFYFWDGLIDPSRETRCNFVNSKAALESMAVYGYPYRVESIGFTRCKIRRFAPTRGKTLIYASAHLYTRGRWPHEGDRLIHEQTLEWLRRYKSSFDEIIIYYFGSLEDNKLKSESGFSLVEIQGFGELNSSTALRQLKGADLVISCNTFGYLSLARGVPTVLIGHDNEFPLHSSNYGAHYGEYSKFCEFPLRLQDMTGEDLLALRCSKNKEIEAWKKKNIGSGFDSTRFVALMAELA